MCLLLPIMSALSLMGWNSDFFYQKTEHSKSFYWISKNTPDTILENQPGNNVCFSLIKRKFAGN